MSEEPVEDDFGFGEVLSPDELAALLASMPPDDPDADLDLFSPDPEEPEQVPRPAQAAELPEADQPPVKHAPDRRIVADRDAGERLSWLFRS